MPLWLPKGATVRRELEAYITEEERRDGYQHVYTPHLAKQELYETSGHWSHYKDDMFPRMELEYENLVLRPMNCPHHILIYSSKRHSYRDLPIRIAELGTMYRYEKSGVVGGLSRVRTMTLNDAHIFCTQAQIKEEFSNVMRLVERAYATLGIEDYTYRLSLRDQANTEKYVANDAMWDMAEGRAAASHERSRAALHGGGWRGSILRAEAGHPTARYPGTGGDDLDHSDRLPFAKPVWAHIHR